jgi:hypothetical protein
MLGVQKSSPHFPKSQLARALASVLTTLAISKTSSSSNAAARVMGEANDVALL